MADTFEFKLVSPEQVLRTSSESHVILPDHEGGQMGIKPGHAPTIAQLGIGVIIINPQADNHSDSSETSYIFITGGFGDIGPNHCTIMAEVANPVASLDKPALEEEVESLQEAIAKTDALADQAPYHESLEIAKSKIAAIESYQLGSSAQSVAA